MPNLQIFDSFFSYNIGAVIDVPKENISLSFDAYPDLKLKFGVFPREYGFGTTIETQVVSVSKTHIKVKVLEICEEIKTPEIYLLVAVPRPQILKRLLEGLAYYPVSELLLVVSERTQKSYLQSSTLRKESLEKHLKLGAMQAGYSFRPRVTLLEKFSILADYYNDEEGMIKLITDQSSSNYIADFLNTSVISDPENVKTRFAIGPEAGWSEREYQFFIDNGYRDIRLADSVLRVDTAALAATSQLYMSWNMIRTRNPDK